MQVNPKLLDYTLRSGAGTLEGFKIDPARLRDRDAVASFLRAHSPEVAADALGILDEYGPKQVAAAMGWDLDAKRPFAAGEITPARVGGRVGVDDRALFARLKEQENNQKLEAFHARNGERGYLRRGSLIWEQLFGVPTDLAKLVGRDAAVLVEDKDGRLTELTGRVSAGKGRRFDLEMTGLPTVRVDLHQVAALYVQDISLVTPGRFAERAQEDGFLTQGSPEQEDLLPRLTASNAAGRRFHALLLDPERAVFRHEEGTLVSSAEAKSGAELQLQTARGELLELNTLHTWAIEDRSALSLQKISEQAEAEGLRPYNSLRSYPEHMRGKRAWLADIDAARGTYVLLKGTLQPEGKGGLGTALFKLQPGGGARTFNTNVDDTRLFVEP